MKMDAAYFIAKFEAIPNEFWRRGTYGICAVHCALGHCGERDGDDGMPVPTKESLALQSIIPEDVTRINDGFIRKYKQQTPRARILAALRDAQKAGR